jgi:hypothetical protein
LKKKVLELGGKCPAYVDGECPDLDVVAHRLVWGKCLNAGHTPRPSLGDPDPHSDKKERHSKARNSLTNEACLSRAH